MKKFLTLTMLGFLAITILGCGSSKTKIPSKSSCACYDIIIDMDKQG